MTPDELKALSEPVRGATVYWYVISRQNGLQLTQRRAVYDSNQTNGKWLLSGRADGQRKWHITGQLAWWESLSVMLFNTSDIVLHSRAKGLDQIAMLQKDLVDRLREQLRTAEQALRTTRTAQAKLRLRRF